MNISEIIQKQRNYYNSQKTKNIKFRLEMLKKLKKAVNDFEDKISQALYQDLKKSPFEAYASEIGLIKKELQMHIKHLRSWAKPKRVKTPILHFPCSSYIYSEPYGLVLIIAPWNFPFQLLVTPLIGAIAAGNCIVLKPSNYSPNTSTLIEKIIKEIFPEEYISIFQGDRHVNQALLKEKFDYIFFTGSTYLGKIVMQAASNHLTPVTLELGGKSPCIIERDANINLAARRLIWGKYLNAGQTCVAPDYLLVDKHIKEKLVNKMIKYITIFFGDNPKESPDFPRIINTKQFERLCSLMKNGSIITGGKTDKNLRYIAPTIIDNISPEDPIMQEEIFGPLLPIIEYDSIDQAISFINGKPKPLALYLFSENKTNQKKVLQKTSSGGGCINDTVIHFANHYLPFGGVGNSGIGLYHGKASFDVFTHKKSILKKSNLIDIPVRYAPSKGKIKLLKLFLR